MIWLLGACGGSDPVPTPTDDPPVVHTPPADGSLTGLGDAPLPVEGAAGRDWRRMDIDQLDASIRRATGGIGWDVNGVNQLQNLSATLGKPDYLQNTYEDLTPNLLFQKFLEDAARAVCDQVMTRERAGGPENVFLVKAGPTDSFAQAPDKIEDNLSYLLLRFHGREVAPGSPELEPWLFLFQGAELASGGDPMVAWRTECIALLTHPDFYTY